MAKRGILLFAGTTLALAAAGAGAQSDEPGVPAGVIARPDAAAAPAASTQEPAGPPRYAPRLPRGTPDDQVNAAAPAPIGTFDKALQRSYWSNPGLLAQRARLRSTDYRLAQARSAAGPGITYQATYGYRRDNVEQPAGSWISRQGWSSTASAILAQPLFTFGRNAAGERRALGEIAFERALLRSTEADTLFNAISAYVGLLRDRTALEIYRDDLSLLEREYADNSARFTRREVTSSDLQQVETRLELSRAQLLLAQRSIASGEARFLSVIGAPPAASLAPPSPLAIPARTLEDAYAHAERHSPLLGAAYARERVSRAAASAARSGLLPRIDLRGSATVATVTPYSNDPRQTELSGQVVISGPLFQSGLLLAQKREADAANDADWRLIDQALRENRADVADAWNEWLARTASIEQLRLSAEAARKAFDGALLQEKAGFRTTLDVLSLARELLQARNSYNDATALAYLAQARLLVLIGALEHDSIFPDVPGYDPGEHLDDVKGTGQIPLIVPMMREVDGLFAGGRQNRPLRDPAAPLATPGVDLPVPVAEIPPPSPPSE